MPRFTLKDLLLSTTVVAIGLAALDLSTSDFARENGILLGLAFWFSSGVIIGAGALAPFGKAQAGAVIGPLVQHSIFVAYMVRQFPLD